MSGVLKDIYCYRVKVSFFFQSRFRPSGQINYLKKNACLFSAPRSFSVLECVCVCVCTTKLPFDSYQIPCVVVLCMLPFSPLGLFWHSRILTSHSLHVLPPIFKCSIATPSNPAVFPSFSFFSDRKRIPKCS